jgi:hypothetical protein
MGQAIEILESVYEYLKARRNMNEFFNEEDKNNNAKLLRQYENAITDYREKQSKKYIYIPTTTIGKNKLKAILENEGRYIENLNMQCENSNIKKQIKIMLALL